MKVGDLVEAPECRSRPGRWCECIFCSEGCKSRLGLVIKHEIVGTENIDLYTVQFGFGEWKVHDTEMNVVSG